VSGADRDDHAPDATRARRIGKPNARTLRPTERRYPWPPASGTAAGLTVTLAGLLFVFLPRRTRRCSLFTLLFALTTLGLLSGCGSGGVDPNGLNPNVLSAGSYTVNVTATGGSTIQTATINLTIQ